MEFIIYNCIYRYYTYKYNYYFSPMFSFSKHHYIYIYILYQINVIKLLYKTKFVYIVYVLYTVSRYKSLQNIMMLSKENNLSFLICMYCIQLNRKFLKTFCSEFVLDLTSYPIYRGIFIRVFIQRTESMKYVYRQIWAQIPEIVF